MLGRAVQLTFPNQTIGDNKITDTLSAQEYLNMIHLDMPIEQIREQNYDGSYLWGDLLNLDFKEDIRIMNLEAAPTLSINNNDIPNKSIHYHVNLNNLPGLFTRFKYPYVLSLSNNHSIDMGLKAFTNETLKYVKNAVGIGINDKIACGPFTINNILIFAFAAGCSGVPSNWGATSVKPGIAYLPPIIDKNSVDIAFNVIRDGLINYQNNNKCIIISIHWGPNWSYSNDGQIFREMLAHKLIDELQVALIYGHSSHHIRGMELYNGHFIIYGAGDFINDYENISEQKNYNTAGALFVIDIDNNNFKLIQLLFIPFKVEKLRCKLMIDQKEINSLISFVNKQSIRDSETPIIL